MTRVAVRPMGHHRSDKDAQRLTSILVLCAILCTLTQPCTAGLRDRLQRGQRQEGTKDNNARPTQHDKVCTDPSCRGGGSRMAAFAQYVRDSRPAPPTPGPTLTLTPHNDGNGATGQTGTLDLDLSSALVSTAVTAFLVAMVAMFIHVSMRAILPPDGMDTRQGTALGTSVDNEKVSNELHDALRDLQTLCEYADNGGTPPLLAAAQQDGFDRLLDQAANEALARQELDWAVGDEEELQRLACVEAEAFDTGSEWMIVEPPARADGAGDDGPAPPPGYQDARALPKYQAEQIVCHVLRENGDADLVGPLRVYVQEKIDEQERQVRKYQDELRILWKSHQHDAVVRADEVRIKRADAEERRARRTAEMQESLRQEIAKQEERVKTLRETQRQESIDSLEKAYDTERQRHWQDLVFRISAILIICTAAAATSVLTNIFGKDETGTRRGWAVGWYFALMMIATEIHRALVWYLGPGGSILSGVIASSTFAVTNATHLMALSQQMHVVIAVVAIPLAWTCFVIYRTGVVHMQRRKMIDDQACSTDSLHETLPPPAAVSPWHTLILDIDQVFMPVFLYLGAGFSACRIGHLI
eukprot:m.185707 g.185707  ORF g.185707 m.185707 type:complete len:587 (-) comp16533_c0_seq1:136-1896(-)